LAAARVQHPAPNFEGQAVVEGDFKKIQLSDFKGKYLVLFFYPLDLYV
jgi:alkyl hydroperoxide reductase subunit AhpC